MSTEVLQQNISGLAVVVHIFQRFVVPYIISRHLASRDGALTLKIIELNQSTPFPQDSSVIACFLSLLITAGDIFIAIIKRLHSRIVFRRCVQQNLRVLFSVTWLSDAPSRASQFPVGGDERFPVFGSSSLVALPISLELNPVLVCVRVYVCVRACVFGRAALHDNPVYRCLRHPRTYYHSLLRNHRRRHMAQVDADARRQANADEVNERAGAGGHDGRDADGRLQQPATTPLQVQLPAAASAFQRDGGERRQPPATNAIR
jgi:hypothetical protein